MAGISFSLEPLDLHPPQFHRRLTAVSGNDAYEISSDGMDEMEIIERVLEEGRMGRIL